MGNIRSKNTRRISFDNTVALTPAVIQKFDEDTDDITDIERKTPREMTHKDSSRFIHLQDDDHDYWVHRIESLKNEHQEINQIIEREYSKTIDNSNTLFESPKITQEKIQKLKPCFDWRAKILQCYEDNPRQPLVCSAIVQAFSNCVSSCQLED